MRVGHSCTIRSVDRTNQNDVVFTSTLIWPQVMHFLGLRWQHTSAGCHRSTHLGECARVGQFPRHARCRLPPLQSRA